MARTVDHVERVSTSFDMLDTAAQADIVAELFSRLSPLMKELALRRIDFHAKMVGLRPKEPRRRNGKDREDKEN